MCDAIASALQLNSSYRQSSSARASPMGAGAASGPEAARMGASEAAGDGELGRLPAITRADGATLDCWPWQWWC